MHKITDSERKIYAYMLRNRGRALYDGELAIQVWGVNKFPNSWRNQIAQHVCNLRQNLSAQNRKNILTIKGVGYMSKLFS